jgi:hypothetical protein
MPVSTAAGAICVILLLLLLLLLLLKKPIAMSFVVNTTQRLRSQRRKLVRGPSGKYEDEMMLKGCGPDRSLLLLITLRTIVPIEPMKRPRMYPIRLPETWTLLAVVVILWLRRAVPQKVSSEKITPHVVVIPLIHATIIVIISVGALREEKIAPVGNVGVVQLEQRQ